MIDLEETDTRKRTFFLRSTQMKYLSLIFGLLQLLHQARVHITQLVYNVV